MGQVDSKEDAQMKALVNKLDKMELKDIEAVFMELASKTYEGESVIEKPTWLNRDKFADALGTNAFFVEELFSAFDRDQNGLIDMQEFVTGMAICLHGTIKKKCNLLFKVFNLDGDDGIDPKELAMVLTNCLQSAQTILRKTSRSEGIYTEEDRHLEDQAGQAIMTSVIVDRIVKDAFDKCDVSHTGKLSIDEFSNWIHRNPKLVNNVFVMQCPKPSQDPGKSNPSFNLEHEDQCEEKDVFIDSEEYHEITSEVVEANDRKQKEPPLNIANLKEPVKPTTLQELFSQPYTKVDSESNFFDSIGNNQQNNEVADHQFFESIIDNSAPRRCQSEVFTEQHFALSSEVHSGSQIDINQSADDFDLLQQSLATQTASESLYSIALSQESLYEGKNEGIEFPDDVQSQFLQSNDIVIDDLAPEADQDHYWRHLQHSISHTETLVDESEESPVINNENVTADEIGIDCLEDDTADRDSIIEHPLDPLDSVQGVPDAASKRSVQGVDDGVSKSYVQDVDDRASKSSVQGVDDGTRKSSVQGVDDGANKSSVQGVDDAGASKYSHAVYYWEPSEQVKEMLQVHADGNIIGDDKLLHPILLVETTMNDPVRELVGKYLGEQEASKRPTPDINHVNLDVEGLHKLLKNSCWRGAIEFTTKYLEAHSRNAEQPVLTPMVIQIWYVRIALLMHLRMFSSAEAELNEFKHLETPDLYYQFYPHLYPGQEGSMVPFSFRLLHAELPRHNGRANVALDRLYNLLGKVNVIYENLSKGCTEMGEKAEEPFDIGDRMKLWMSRKISILYSIANCFLGMKDYLLCVKLLEEIIVLEPYREIPILSAIGRIYLQLGDCRTAQKYFNRIGQVSEVDSKSLSMTTMNVAYSSLAKGDYEDAYQQFLSALELDEDNLAACNNAAVCLLFMGKVKEASDILETMVCKSPGRSLHEEILLNLTTVYELETSRALQKKHKLLDLVSKHKGDGFNVQCLKLT